MGNLCYSAHRTRLISSAILPKNPTVKSPRTPKKAIPKAMKRLVWDTYIGEDIGKSLCLCCNHVYIRQIEFHCGHVRSEAEGGEINVSNLRPICAQCNLSMGKTNMNEFKKMFITVST